MLEIMFWTNIKRGLKKIPFLYSVNARWKANLIKNKYRALLKHYSKIVHLKGSPCTMKMGLNHITLHGLNRDQMPTEIKNGELRVLYVGTDKGQDYGGIIQGLKKFGEAILFEQTPGVYGQKLTWSRSVEPAKLNGERITEIVSTILEQGPLHAIIGQMWGHSMDCNALKKIQELGIPIVNIAMDDRHAFRGEKVDGKWSGTSGLIGAIDLACTAAKECCQWYDIEGCPSIYLPEASDPELYQPMSGQKEYDVTFVGANYGIRRKVVEALLKESIEVTCFGDNWPNGRIDVTEIPELFSKSHIILGVGTIGHCKDFYSLKMRDFDGPMSGSLYITHDNPDLYDLFDVGREIVTYRTPLECAHKVKYYLSHPDEREAIAKAGRERAASEHTWDQRFRKVFEVLGLLKGEGLGVN